MIRQFQQIGFSQSADGVERPNRAQLMGHVVVGSQYLTELLINARGELSGSSPFLENPARVPDKPLVLVKLALHEPGVIQRRKIKGLQRLGFAVDHLVDPSAGAVGAVAIVTLAEVVPIGSKDSPVGSVLNRDGAKPGIVRHQK